MYLSLIKPTFDWILALIVLLLLIPVFMLLSVIIKIDTRGPVFFIQSRLGKDGKEFKIFKFRSMSVTHSKPVNNIQYEDDPRITRVGRIIRKTSLDELPQLINIVKGEMSFIGPRPPVTHFPKKYSEYSDFEKERFSVKPGISGLAQVRAREEHDWDKNIPVDVEYARTVSFKLDLKLFLKSITFFFRTDNIYRRK